MYNDKNVENIINNIKNIEEQIKFFQKKNNLFWKNNDYVDRVESLENIKRYLYRLLEKKLDNE